MVDGGGQVHQCPTFSQPLPFLPASFFVAAVKEIRMVRDKYTAAPRGFAFVHFYTVPDAAKALHALQVTNP